jgi:phenylacetate-CoA ligase
VALEGNAVLAEMICTGFIPRAAPLIRYRVGDCVLINEKERCKCGAPGPVIKEIRGRTSDYILTPDGRKYPHISLIVDLLRNVRHTQVVQEERDTIVVRIVPSPEFNEEDELHVIDCFKNRIGGDINVVVRKVNELERHQNGKILSIINRLNANRGLGYADCRRGG